MARTIINLIARQEVTRLLHDTVRPLFVLFYESFIDVIHYHVINFSDMTTELGMGVYHDMRDMFHPMN